MTLYVGQKVECITELTADARRRAAQCGGVMPVRRVTYTVRGFVPGFPHLIYLSELRNPINSLHSVEWGFHGKHFRPVVDRKTDISIFTKMLTDSKIPVTIG